MQIDPSVSQAFATLETAFHTDFLNRLPSRHNLMYRQFLERQFMLRIGTALVTLPESVDQLWIAHLIQRYFWHELDFPVRPKLPTELPRFLWSKSFRLPEIDLVSLSQKIETLRQQKFDGMPDPLCIAERKLFQLEMLLHLQPTEIALIELAYASSPDGWPQSESEAFEPDRHALHALLMCLNWCDVAERDHIFSILLNVSTFDVAVLFTNPSTLLALHLIDSSYWHQGNGAFAYATATEKLFMVLETQYLTNVAMLADLQSPPFDAALAEDSDVPDVLLHEQLPRLVADAYIAARRSLKLTADQLSALVKWQTGIAVKADVFQSLDLKLEFESVRQALAEVVLVSRKANQTITMLTLVRALHTII